MRPYKFHISPRTWVPPGGARSPKKFSRQPKVTIDLKKLYPLASRSLARRCVPWILGYAAFIFSISLLEYALSSPYIAESIQEVFTSIVDPLRWVGLFLVVGKLGYEFLHHMIYGYALEEGCVVVTTGILFRRRGSIPLQKITDMVVDHDPLDWIFWVADVVISTASNESKFSTLSSSGHLIIRGLTCENARGLQDFLQEQLLAATTTPRRHVPSDDRAEPRAIWPPAADHLPEPHPPA